MPDTTLKVALREDTGKGAARKLRAAGRIPGTCYGRALPSASIHIDPAALERLLAHSSTGMNTLIDLSVEGGGDFDGKTVLVKDLQREPIYGRPLHADLYAVDLTQTIVIEVPVHITGVAEGVKLGGGILDHSLREIELECLPMAIPGEIVVDVSALEVGDSLHVRDLSLPDGVELRTDGDLSVVSVVMPAAAEAEPTAEAAAEGVAPAVEGEEAPEGTAAKPEESSDDD